MIGRHTRRQPDATSAEALRRARCGLVTAATNVRERHHVATGHAQQRRRSHRAASAASAAAAPAAAAAPPEPAAAAAALAAAAAAKSPPAAATRCDSAVNVAGARQW